MHFINSKANIQRQVFQLFNDHMSIDIDEWKQQRKWHFYWYKQIPENI